MQKRPREERTAVLLYLFPQRDMETKEVLESPGFQLSKVLKAEEGLGDCVVGLLLPGFICERSSTLYAFTRVSVAAC